MASRIFGIKTDNYDYAYAYGRIKAMETALLKRDFFLSLASAADFSGIVKMLQNTLYQHFASMKNAAEVSVKRVDETLALVRLIRELSLDEELTGLLYLRYDSANLKMLLAEKYLGAPRRQYFEGFNYTPAFFRYILEYPGSGELEGSGIASYVQEAAMKALHIKDPFLLDLTVDRTLLDYAFSVIDREDCGFMRDYYILRADYLNIVSLLKAKKFGYDKSTLQLILNGHGSVKDEEFLKCLTGNLQVKDLFPHHSLSAAFERAGADSAGLEGMELSFSGIAAEYMRGAKLHVFGPEFLIAYYIARESEIKILEMIIRCVLRGASPDYIMERIPSSYA